MRSQGRSRISALQLIKLRSPGFVFWIRLSLFLSSSSCCNGQISFIIYPSVFSVEGLPVAGLSPPKVLRLAMDDTKAPQITAGNLGKKLSCTELVGSRAEGQSGSGHMGQGTCSEFKPLLMLPGRWKGYFPERQELSGRNHTAMQSQGQGLTPQALISPLHLPLPIAG